MVLSCAVYLVPANYTDDIIRRVGSSIKDMRAKVQIYLSGGQEFYQFLIKVAGNPHSCGNVMNVFPQKEEVIIDFGFNNSVPNGWATISIVSIKVELVVLLALMT